MKSIILFVATVLLLAVSANADCQQGDLFCNLGVPSQTVVAGSLTTGPAGDVVRGYAAAFIPTFLDPRYIQLTGVRVTGGGGKFEADAVVFGIDNYDITGYFIAYFEAKGQVNGNSSSASAAAAALGVRFLGLVEYVESGNAPGFQLGADTVVGGYNFSVNAAFGNLVYGSYNQSDGTTVYYATASSVDNVFGFRVTTAGKPRNINGVNIDANSLKLDVLVNYYNPLNVASAWSTGASSNPNSTIALIVGVGGFAVGTAGVKVTSAGDPLGNGFKNVAVNANGQVAGFQYNTNFTLGNAQTFNFVGAVSGSWHDNITSGIGQYDNQFTAGVFSGYAGVQLCIFSAINQVRPGPIYWDPTSTISNPGSGSSSTTNASMVNVPVAMFVLFALLFSLIKKNL